MTAELSSGNVASLASTLAPEDVERGDYVAVLNEIVELPSFLWGEPIACGPEELVRVRCCAVDAGLPLKVKAVCLPFLFVRSPDGRGRTIDVRQVQLVRLAGGYARCVWKALRNDHTSSLKHLSAE